MQTHPFGRLETNIEATEPGTFVQVAVEDAAYFALATPKRPAELDDGPPLLVLTPGLGDQTPCLRTGDLFTGRAYAFDEATVVPDPESVRTFTTLQRVPVGALVDDGSFGICGALGPSANAERGLFRLNGSVERLPAPIRIVLFTRWSVVIPWREDKDLVLLTTEAAG